MSSQESKNLLGNSGHMLVANSPTSSLVAIYKPSMTQNTTTRITVQCYDRHTLVSTPKFSLSVPIHDSASSDGMTDSQKESLIDLVFASSHRRLVGCIAATATAIAASVQEHSLIIWDVTRGVPIQPRIVLPVPYQILHIATSTTDASGEMHDTEDINNNNQEDKLFVLGYHATNFKLVVFVYHVGYEDSWKLIQKIKVGITLNLELVGGVSTTTSFIPYRSCVLAVCTSYHALVVRVPYLNKKLKVINMDTGHAMGKCKIPSLSSSILSSTHTQLATTTTTPTSDTLVFSKDGSLLALYTSNTSMDGNIFLWDLSTIYNKSVNEFHESDYEDEDKEMKVGDDDDDDDDEDNSPRKDNKKKKKKMKDHHHSHVSCIGILSATHRGNTSTPSLHSAQVSMEIEQIVTNTASSLITKEPTILILFTDGYEKQCRLYTLSHKQKNSSSTEMIHHTMSWTCDPKDTKAIVSASLAPSIGQIVLVQGPKLDEFVTKDSRLISSTTSSISFSLVSFLNTQVQKGDSSFLIQTGDIILPMSSAPMDKRTEIVKKRKANAMAGQVVIGPGESGGEAIQVSDIVTTSTITVLDKEQRAVDEEEEDFFKISAEEQDEIGDDGQTIEQRLASLNAQLYEEDEMSDGEGDDNGDNQNHALVTDSSSGNIPPTRFNVKAATSGSLETLLRQALASNDDSQLEIALQVVDKKVIENSILGLAVNVVDTSNMGDIDADESVNKSSELVLSLLSKLATRLAKKPTRAEALAYWIRTILFVLISSHNDGDGGLRMGEMERQVALKLGPLRNLLSERVECLPALLKLEGRLELLTQHRSI